MNLYPNKPLFLYPLASHSQSRSVLQLYCPFSVSDVSRVFQWRGRCYSLPRSQHHVDFTLDQEPLPYCLRKEAPCLGLTLGPTLPLVSPRPDCPHLLLRPRLFVCPGMEGNCCWHFICPAVRSDHVTAGTPLHRCAVRGERGALPASPAGCFKVLMFWNPRKTRLVLCFSTLISTPDVHIWSQWVQDLSQLKMRQERMLILDNGLSAFRNTPTVQHPSEMRLNGFFWQKTTAQDWTAQKVVAAYA